MPEKPFQGENQQESVLKQLKKYGIRPTKKLGQHFLFDEKILSKIVDAADLKSGEVVLEVGPGPGSLTNVLLRKGAKVIAVEKDKRFIDFLNERFAQEKNLILLHKDALNSIEEIKAFRPSKMVANLPYNIASTLIVDYLINFDFLKLMVVMVQKEVAQRLAALPGNRNYGSLTVKVQSLASVDMLFQVKPGSFYPPPNVYSEVILIKRLPKIDPELIEEYFKFIEVCFRYPRKTLVNNLTGIIFKDKVEAQKFVNDMSLNEKVRPQEISVNTYLHFFHRIREIFVN